MHFASGPHIGVLMDRPSILWHSSQVVMNQHFSANRSTATACGGFLVLVLTLVVSAACRREVSAAEMNGNSNTPAGPAPAARFDESAFLLIMEPDGAYTTGKAGVVRVRLTAKGPHHVNQEYPHKLKLKAVEGVTYPQSVIQRDAMKIENDGAQIAVALTPNRSGKLTVEGDFAFSLCTADRCLMEKRPLALEIQVQ
jgi:hypothetical protein